jgi:formate C-acetyltransferase
MSPETRIFSKLAEPFAAGLYEEHNASMNRRWGRALKRYAESVGVMPECDGPLYPAGEMALWNVHDAAVSPNYSFSLGLDAGRLREKIERQLDEGREREVAGWLVSDLQTMATSPLSSRYGVGGSGFTHSILHYDRILQEGLPEYERRIERGLDNARDAGTCDFFLALKDTFDAVMLLLRKACDACSEGMLKDALSAAARRPPRDFPEALALINFMFYVDGCDSVGALDRYLSRFYRRDLAAGDITPERAKELVSAFYRNVDANSGWHMVLGSEDADEEVTVLCLQALDTRRPNSGLKIAPDTSDAVWEAAFDGLQKGSGNPAFYNDRAYREGAVRYAHIAAEDLPYIAYGGCTEFMVEGRSNVGSIDAGINLLQVLSGTIRAEFPNVSTFGEFLNRFKADIRRHIDTLTTQVNLNQQYKATYRPQLIRTLFIDDCLETATEYNQGGARYNGGVINVAGIANVANSLYALRAVLNGSLDAGRDDLLDALRNDYEGYGELRQQLLALPKFGNHEDDVDRLAKDVTDFTFDEIAGHRCWRADGFFIPATIMFTTYAREGKDVSATPDGRKAGAPIADSCGPMQGTDTEGPTAMLGSVAELPLKRGLGTMILNLRVSAALLASQETRRKLKSLLLSYFEMDGMQVQLTVLDRDRLEEALEHPEHHENLIVRVGGYTEYFNRLSEPLKREIVKRTEYV